MIKNYCITAWRNLWRQKGYSLINILGLAVGMACCLLMLLYVNHELSFDRFHPDADRIYRLNVSAKMGEIDNVGNTTPPPLAQRMMQDFAEVERATRIFPLLTLTVQHQNKVFNESGILATDEHFFQMFRFPIVEASSTLLLKEPQTAVLTQSAAIKYFGNESPLGKTLLMGPEHREFKVIGVVENPPNNTHFTFEILTSISTYKVVQYFDWSWVWCQLVTYVQLKPGVSAAALQAKIPQMVDKYAPAAFDRIGQSYADLKKQGGHWNFLLQPLTAIHLYSGSIGNRLGGSGSIQTVYIFSAIAILIITLACINFINLTTARGARRAKEIGVRKSLGVSKSGLVVQFLAESFLMSAMAMVIALCLVEFALAPFNTLSGKMLRLDMVNNPQLLLSIISLTLLVGLVAGVYPALYLSRVKPVDVLAGSLRLGMKNSWLRNALVVFQFAISVGLIACTVIVYAQLQFVQTMNLGFEKENLLVVNNIDDLKGKEEIFKQSIFSHSPVMNASLSTSAPGRGYFLDFYKPESAPLKDLALASFLADEALLPTLGARVVAGRNFSKEYPADCAGGILINEDAVRKIGWTNPIGQYISYPGGNNAPKYQVVGVFKNFNVESLHSPIVPFAVFHRASKSYNIRGACMIVRVRAGQSREAVAAVEREWNRIAGRLPFDYTFLDAEFDKLFRSEQRLGNVLGMFTLLAIFIACLGLLGLAAYATEVRTKEIGIRKVLGASVTSIVTLLSKDFLRLVLVAIGIALPIGWYGMYRWLQDFAYRTEISWWMFGLAGALAVIIAMITVAGQSFRAARANPVESLRSE